MGDDRTIILSGTRIRNARRQAKDGEAGQVGAPMPGMVVAIRKHVLEKDCPAGYGTRGSGWPGGPIRAA